MPTARAPRETARLEILKSYRVLDTPPEPAFDAIVALAKDLFQVPIAGIALLDEQRVWLKAVTGYEGQEIPREEALCELALASRDVLVIPDAAADARARDRAVVTSLGLRFYAGAPLRTPHGVQLGALFIADRRPGKLGPADRRRLKGLGSLVMEQLDLRAALCRIAPTDDGLQRVAEAVAMETGEAFVVALTRCLPEALGVDYAFVSETDPAEPGVAHCTVCERGRTHRFMDYDLEGTPCAAVVAGEPRCYPRGVQTLFPADAALQTLGAEGYAAVPLRDARRRMLGILGVLCRTPIPDGSEVLTQLGIFGPRAAAEMERLRAERLARTRERRREALVSALPDMVFHIRRDGTYVDFHPGLGAAPLVPPEQFLGRRVTDVLPADVAREGVLMIARALDEGGMQVWRYELDARTFEARIVPGAADEVVAFVREITA
ncbi:MAG TPA: GAF domain-containing protein [Planctomycetota bacterium]|nr:GAF domain-containing protein [Planctomycetota bacterium]